MENNHKMKTVKDKEQEMYYEMNKNLISFHKQFNYDDNDRAIVISGMSFIDDLLLNILESFFPDKSNTVDNLLSHRGALGTYGTRVDIIYCLGFIDKVIKTDLDILGQIRNKFAHKLNVSFDDEDIKQLCLKLRWHEIFMFMKAPEGATSKEIFQVGLNTIVSHLNVLPRIARNQKRKIKE